MNRRRLGAGIVSIVVVLGACGGDESAEPVTEGTVSRSTVPADLDSNVEDGITTTSGVSGTSTFTEPAVESVQLVPLATFESLTALAVDPLSHLMYVTDRGGRVHRINPDDSTTEVLDITESVNTDGERGLLGLTFDSSGERLFLHYSNLEGNTVVDAFDVADGSVDASSRREIYFLEQPFSNHNGGQIETGPDGYLYLGLGDGGGGGDPFGAGQDPHNPLGKVLRIEPDAEGIGSGGYAIPEDNPFFDGVDGAREVYILGLRNPWRFSFDRDTGDLWIADVGQDNIEEIDLLPAGAASGANLGWAIREGDQPHSDLPDPGGLIEPILTYDRSGGACSVTGGYVYRGELIDFLEGVYLYGDFCVGDLLGVRVEAGSVVEEIDLGVSVGEQELVSFGQDADGEILVLSLSGQLYRLAPG